MRIIYVDSSVVLAFIRTEANRPTAAFWLQPGLFASSLTRAETWTRLHAYGQATQLEELATNTLGSINFIELTSALVARCRWPFPIALRTLDALHMATAEHLQNERGYTVEVAAYDGRVLGAAQGMGFALHAYPVG